MGAVLHDLKIVIVTININGLQRKEHQLLDTLHQNKIDIALITELHLISTETERRLNKKKYKLFTNPTDGNNYNGTGIIIRKRLSNEEVQHSVIQKGRMNELKIKYGDQFIHIICCYLQSGVNIEHINSRVQYINLLSSFLLSLPIVERSFIIGGDFNFIESTLDTSNPQHFVKFNDANAMEQLQSTFGLFDSYRLKHPAGQIYTRIETRGGRRIDRFYTTANFRPNNLQTNFIPISYSDHNAAPVLKISRKNENKWGKNPWKLNNSLLDEKSKEDFILLWEDIKLEKVRF